MTYTIIAVALLLLHIVCCVLIYIGIRSGALKIRRHIMPLVIFVPVTGPICCLLLSFQIFLGKNDSKKVGVEKMRVQDPIYKGILHENADSQDQTISLEEALIINDSKTKRNLMLDVLYDNPEQYMDVLLMARMNDDAEVVHYATTAMAELSKGYDAELQRLEQMWSAAPQDQKVLEEYSNFLRRMLEQGIAEGEVARTRRKRYSELLNLQLRQSPTMQKYRELAKNEMELGNFDEAKDRLAMMEQLWPNDQEVHMLKVEYYARSGQGEALQKQIEEIDRRQIYLYRKNREKLEFWRAMEDGKA